MENLDFNAITVVGLSLVVLIQVIQYFTGLRANKGTDKKVSNIADNHLHDISDSLLRIERSIERMGDNIGGKLDRIRETQLQMKRSNGNHKK